MSSSTNHGAAEDSVAEETSTEISNETRPADDASAAAEDAAAEDVAAEDAAAEDVAAEDAAAEDVAAEDAAAEDVAAHSLENADSDAPVEAASLSILEAQASVEALLYASAAPLSVRDLKKALPEAPELVQGSLTRLQEIYDEDGRGVQLVEVAGGWQITTRPAYHECVGRLVESPKPARLSLQALETLAVIAYRQPVTVPEIMELRGVRSAGVVRTLLERKLVKISGRKNVVGRPLLYSTTKEFLLRFGLKGISDLPQLKDMSEVFGDDVAQQLEVLESLEPTPEGADAGGA